MADRVKYFLLGLLFLVVAGVIAYDRAYDSWNSDGAPEESARREAQENRGEASVGRKPDPLLVKPEPLAPVEPPAKSPVDPNPPQPPREEPRTIPPEEMPPPPAPSPEPVKKVDPVRYHTIRAGETLEAIAMQYYKTRAGVAWIVDANKIRDPNRIRLNSRLVIPTRSETEAGKTTVVAPGKAKPTKIPARHVVRSGDGDLYSICRRFYGTGGEGARVAEIMSLNNLFSADVAVGTEIRLPPK